MNMNKFLREYRGGDRPFAPPVNAPAYTPTARATNNMNLNKSLRKFMVAHGIFGSQQDGGYRANLGHGESGQPIGMRGYRGRAPLNLGNGLSTKFNLPSKPSAPPSAPPVSAPAYTTPTLSSFNPTAGKYTGGSIIGG